MPTSPSGLPSARAFPDAVGEQGQRFAGLQLVAGLLVMRFRPLAQASGNLGQRLPAVGPNHQHPGMPGRGRY